MQPVKTGFRLVFFCLPLLSLSVFADSCPSADAVKARKVSRVYAWYIDERRTLEDVLAVKKLYSARLKNNGEYVRCYYSGNGRLLEMDAWPLESDCSVIKYEGEWQQVIKDELVCVDDDMSRCQFAIYCDQRTEKK